MVEQKPKTIKELRKFGYVMAGAFGLITLLLLYKEIQYFSLVAAIAGLFLLLAIGFPSVLRPIEYVWMKIAMVLGAIMTRVILTLVFVLAVTPIGLLMRAVGKDPLRLKKPGGSSYWLDADREGTAARPDKPF